MKLIILILIIFPISNICTQEVNSQTIDFFKKGKVEYYRTQIDNKFGIVDQKGNIELAHIYSEMSMFTKNLIRVKILDQGYGLLDLNFNTILPCQYDKLEIIRRWHINGGPVPSSETDNPKRHFILKKEGSNSQFSFIDTTGNVLSENVFNNPSRMRIFHDVVFDEVGVENEKFHKLRREKFIIKSLTGEVVLQDTIYNISTISSSGSQYLLKKGHTYLALQNSKNKYALFDLQKREVVSEYEYDRIILPISREKKKPEFVLGNKNNLFYLINLSGEKLSDLGFIEVQFKDNFHWGNSEIIKFDNTDVKVFMRDEKNRIFALYHNNRIERITD